MAPYHRIYRIALVLLLAAVSGCGGNEAPDISAAAATQDNQAKTELYDQVKTELEKGWTYAYDDDWDTAIACFTEAIRLDPNYVGAYEDRGWAYVNKGEDDKAIHHSRDPKQPRLGPRLRTGQYAH